MNRIIPAIEADNDCKYRSLTNDSNKKPKKDNYDVLKE